MKLGELISDRKAQLSAMRQMRLEPQEWRYVRVFAQLPFVKDSEVALVLHVGDRPPVAPRGFDEFGDIADLEEWAESFDEKSDPAQALIDYVTSLYSEQDR